MLRAQTVAFRQPLTLSVGGTRSFFWRSTSAAPTAQTTLKDPSCAPKSSSTETPSVAVEGSDTIGTALSRDLNTLNIKSAPMDPLPSAPESILPDAASVLTSPATSDLFTACLSLSHFAITPVLLGGLVALLPELVFKKQTEWRKYDLMRHENGDALVRTMRYIDRKSRNMAVDAKDVDVVKKTMDAFGVKDPTFFKQMTLMPFFQLGGVSVLYFETGRVSRWFMSPETSQLFSAADGSASSIWMTLAERPLALALFMPTYFYYMREVNRVRFIIHVILSNRHSDFPLISCLKAIKFKRRQS